MAVIFSKHGGQNDEAWKVIDTELSMVIQDTDTEKNKDDELVKSLFNVKTSKKFGEKQGSMTEFGNFEEVTEGDNGIADDYSMGFSKLIEHHQFIKTFLCTREAKDDGNIDMMKQTAANFVRAYKRSRAQYASDALVAEGTTFLYGGKSYDKTTGDGKGLFATDHLGKKTGVPEQCNVFTTAFGNDATNLYKLANIGRNFKNQSGNVMGYTFDTIIIPGNTPRLEDLIKRIIHSEQIVGSDFNDINTQKGIWKLIVNHRWEAASGTEPYIIMSSEAQRELNAGVFFDRVALDVSNEVLNKSRNLEWSGYARWSAGFNNWAAYIMGGAQSGQSIPS
jgi:hypothetical protein